MSVRDLIPWGRNSKVALTGYKQPEPSPFLTLHREMNRLFDDVLRDFGSPVMNSGGAGAMLGRWPHVEIADSGSEITLTAEVPGLEEDDIEVLVEDDALVLRGEKRSETEDKDRAFSERFYGRFERVIPLAGQVKQDSIRAFFKNGLLTVKMPKLQDALTKAKRIAINGKEQVH